MAEEDRYSESTGLDAQNDVDFLAGEIRSMTSEMSEPTKPLISFDQSPEPTAPPLPTESVPGAKADSGEGKLTNTNPLHEFCLLDTFKLKMKKTISNLHKLN